MKRFLSVLLLAAASTCAIPSNAAQKVTDDQIYNDVRRRLANDPDVKGGALNVDVVEGKVTVKGMVDTEKAHNKVEKVVRKAKGVSAVENLTTVKLK